MVGTDTVVRDEIPSQIMGWRRSSSMEPKKDEKPVV